MTQGSARIEQFRKMTEADPENVLGHYSLGQAYLEAGMYEQSAASFERAIGLDANLSKAYQLLGTALLQLGRRDEAIGRLTEGVKVASRRGDMMPRNAMVKMLQELGAEVPAEAMAGGPQAQAVDEGEVLCARCGQVKRKMASPPFRHPQGEVIQQRICPECWREWIHMGTKVINELRLPLSDPQAQRIYDQHMLEFLNLK